MISFNPLAAKHSISTLSTAAKSMEAPALKRSSIELQKQLDKCKSTLDRLEQWEFSHYRENGFLAWIAKLILWLTPSSQARLSRIEKLEASLAKASLNEACPTKACLTKACLAKEKLSQPIPIKAGVTDIQQKKSSSRLLYKKSSALPASPTPSELPSTNISKISEKNPPLTAVKLTSWALETACDELQTDKKIALAAVMHDGHALEFTTDKLKADREVVLAAIKENGCALKYASPDLRADQEIAMIAVQENGYALSYLSTQLQADRAIVMAAVTRNGKALQFASHELKADKAIILAAVKEDGYALQYAAGELKADNEIILAATTQSKGALKYALTPSPANKITLKEKADEQKATEESFKVDRKPTGGDLEPVLSELSTDEDCSLVVIPQDPQEYQENPQPPHCANTSIAADFDAMLSSLKAPLLSSSVEIPSSTTLNSVEPSCIELPETHTHQALIESEKMALLPAAKLGARLDSSALSTSHDQLQANEPTYPHSVKKSSYALSLATSGYALLAASGHIATEAEPTLVIPNPKDKNPKICGPNAS